ncbi:Os04g0638401 [Oryza sativa Japonica Group]|uniref:Os04g0638401 protein n=1 Tax=Oryza sativa subsp. japonica TaxID=39947 RepID=C7J1X4_ORYSJ|nr:Os04g0638401 [Oryza sativa Japonica Group]|eukprot:NP_001174111.1 Os04g0638401 [Oryza sativa Japonica Group]
MSLMSAVNIVDVSYVAVPATAALPPEPIKLTAMEALWLPFPVLQHVLFYEAAGLTPFDSVVDSLRSSLGATLATFAPLAGKLVHLEDTGDVAIACSASDAVRFVEAECDADVRRVAGDEAHDLRTFEQLVPELDMSKLPTSVLAVQATRLQGGLAVGVTLHHGVADGKSFWTFVEAWASACRCRGEAPAATPCFDRSVIKWPGGEEIARSVLRKYAPNLPELKIKNTCNGVAGVRAGLACRGTQAFHPPDIHRGRAATRTPKAARITRDGEVHGKTLHRPPSSFVAVVAMASAFFARCKTTAADEDAGGDVFLFFFADVRERLDDPPVDAGYYFGACLTGCLARLPARDVHGDGALAAAASAIQEEILELAEDPLAGWNFMSLAGKIPSDRVMNVSGSPGFRPYDVGDFGWGKPRRTEPIRMNHDGQVALVRAADGHGVQVSVSLLQSAHMEAFKSQMRLLELK